MPLMWLSPQANSSLLRSTRGFLWPTSTRPLIAVDRCGGSNPTANGLLQRGFGDFGDDLGVHDAVALEDAEGDVLVVGAGTSTQKHRRGARKMGSETLAWRRYLFFIVMPRVWAQQGALI